MGNSHKSAEPSVAVADTTAAAEIERTASPRDPASDTASAPCSPHSSRSPPPPRSPERDFTDDEPIFLKSLDALTAIGQVSPVPSWHTEPPRLPPAHPSHGRASCSSCLSLCANCRRMASPRVFRRESTFCCAECYWSWHVRLGLDDERDKSMHLRAHDVPAAIPDSYVANRTVQRHRKSLSQQTSLIRRDSNDSPRSRSTNGGACPSTSRESLAVPSTPEPAVAVSPRSALSCEPCAEVEEFAEELDESLPTPSMRVPKAPILKSLKPFHVNTCLIPA